MRIYLDHNATTPLRQEVVEAMLPWLRDHYGNPSSTHAEGALAQRAVETARTGVAQALGVASDEVTWTSGATEANNTALRSVLTRSQLGRHLIVSAVEHPSVLEPAAWLEAQGVRVSRIAVDGAGLLDLDALDEALQGGPALVAMLWANNETGVVQPPAIRAALAERVQQAGGHLHVDVTQALGKMPIDLRAEGVDSAACSAHKLNGPKGTGALLCLRPDALEPLLQGGPQEKRLRGGTENVAGIAGFGTACQLASDGLEARAQHCAALRDRLWEGIRSKIPAVHRNGAPESMLPNTLNVEFEATAGEVLVQALDLEGIAVSMGAACHSGAITPSHVLTAMGRSPEQSRASLRFSVGHGNDEQQIDRSIEVTAELVARVRSAGIP